MGVPFRGLDRVRAGERIVVVAILDIRLGEYAHAAELARLPGTVAGGEDDFGGN